MFPVCLQFESPYFFYSRVPCSGSCGSFRLLHSKFTEDGREWNESLFSRVYPPDDPSLCREEVKLGPSKFLIDAALQLVSIDLEDL